jgi:hypothetical protein
MWCSTLSTTAVSNARAVFARDCCLIRRRIATSGSPFSTSSAIARRLSRCLSSALSTALAVNSVSRSSVVYRPPHVRIKHFVVLANGKKLYTIQLTL